MKKAIYFIFLLISNSASAQSGERWYDIKAFLPGWQQATVTLMVDEKKVHSATLSNDMFPIPANLLKPAWEHWK